MRWVVKGRPAFRIPYPVFAADGIVVCNTNGVAAAGAASRSVCTATRQHANLWIYLHDGVPLSRAASVASHCMIRAMVELCNPPKAPLALVSNIKYDEADVLWRQHEIGT